MLSPSWNDIIAPRGREARDDRERVTARVVAHVEAAAASPHRAEALAMPAEEIARVLVIHDVRGLRALEEPCERHLLQSAIHEVEAGRASPAGILGLMSYANTCVVGGRDVRELHDSSTRRLLRYERTWLGDLSRRARELEPAQARLAMLIAIAIGEDREAPRFGTPPPTIAPIVARPDDHDAYVELVASFPDVELTWGELLFVARAFVGRVERRPREIGASARWLHQLVRGDRPIVDAPEPVRAPEPPSAEIVRRASELFDEASSRPANAQSWFAIELRHMHGLWGGHDLRIRVDGTVTVRARTRGGALTCHRARLSALGFDELARFVADLDLLRGVEPARPGVPDEASASITIVMAAERLRAWKWDRDVHDAFDRLRDWLDALARAAIATRPGAPEPDLRDLARTLEPEVAVVWARYLSATMRTSVAASVIEDDERRRWSHGYSVGALELLGTWSAFPELESLCNTPPPSTGYFPSRALGEALARRRWLPALRPLLEGQSLGRAVGVIHGAIDAMLSRAEPGDTTRMLDVLVPAARSIEAVEPYAHAHREAASCRRAALGDLAAALAACKATDAAAALVAELRLELEGLDPVELASARCHLAPALMALGRRREADEMLASAERDLDVYFADDVDDRGTVWFDEVAGARARVEHLAGWRHGMPWSPAMPVSRRFTGPVTVQVFPPERAAQEGWRSAIDFHVRASKLDTDFSKGQLARAMDIVDASRESQPTQVPWLISHLAQQIDVMDDVCAARVIAWLDGLAGHGDVGGYSNGASACVGALARSGRGEVAIVHARRIDNPYLRAGAMAEAAVALAGRSKTRELGLNACLELLAEHGPELDRWRDMAEVILDDQPPYDMPIVIRGAGDYPYCGTFALPAQAMHLVLALGNGLEGDVRWTCNNSEAVLVARGLIMGTGGCRRIEPPADSMLYRPGDECYRQHEEARVFLDITPTG